MLDVTPLVPSRGSHRPRGETHRRFTSTSYKRGDKELKCATWLSSETTPPSNAFALIEHV